MNKYPDRSWSRIHFRFLDGTTDEIHVPSQWITISDHFLDVLELDPFGDPPTPKKRSFPMLWVREIEREEYPEGTEVVRGDDGIRWTWDERFEAWFAKKPEPMNPDLYFTQVQTSRFGSAEGS